jgi:hypothetical protein
MDRVFVGEAGNLALAHWLLGYCRREIRNHLPCRRYMASIKLLFILYKLLLLLWGEFFLCNCLLFMRLRLALVCSRQR